jgi:hypothetical protein
MATETLLNSALADDALDDGYVCVSSLEDAEATQRAKTKQILGISIYVASGEKRTVSVGKRVTYYYDTAPDFAAILHEERTGTYISRVQEESGRRSDMAVLGEILPLPPCLTVVYTLCRECHS